MPLDAQQIIGMKLYKFYNMTSSILPFKPIFHQPFCGRVGTDNAIYFALGTFQRFFSPIRIYNFFFNFAYSLNMTPDLSLCDEKSMWNIGRTICVGCTFHLRWALLPTQNKRNAWWNIGFTLSIPTLNFTLHHHHTDLTRR